MRLNSTVALTLILLSMMFGAGIISAALGFNIGREALKGITQPDSSPTSTMVNRQPGTTGKTSVPILKEEEILKRVDTYIEGEEANESQEQSFQPTPDSSQQAISEPKEPTLSLPGFPIAAQDRGVTLEISAAYQQQENLELDVKIRNDSPQMVRFLYSLLNITDNRGRSLTATTSGLPSQVPPNQEEFSGKVSVPVALLADAQHLSMKLTDYPDEELHLQVSGIPVVR
ncbi:MAG: hypothetical protein J7545_20760 [Roseofilum sp. SBFL]|uniref:hypothetical protein n=1 Tax=unclassified Roseofilum TaxID=2620099 RepID=UPI001B03602A|nr:MULTISPECIES: hypothetical protein [unclassified Roseofilum]MBP0012807.1 hypothetical protein [Roseofilum sp. SID3]MBP0025185.1 hypothetical protein [Roseofilum sp. SID2]MBP0039799.1 hypothetical protein [Roseofilum sp. SID1]MBP0044372.1 hypothetical protein [Roseofilum sp. SBFL]